MDLVIVRTFLNRFEADLAKSALDAVEIDSLIRTDDAGGMKPGMSMGSTVKLMVREEDAERAADILNIPASPRPHEPRR